MGEKIILFDGVCNLCNRSVQFIIQRDKNRLFKFASLQSEFGRQVLSNYKMDTENLKSFLFLDNNRLHTQSGGALRVTKYLGGFWQLLYVFIIVPPFIRNGIYNWIAKNRYRWFGKKEACWIPSPELTNRFIS